MKGRTCADGWKQSKKAVPRDATYPTVYMESILITATIDVREGRNSSLRKITGAFLSVYMDEDMKMALRRRLAELTVNISPQIYR